MELTIRFSEARDGYEILFGDELLDYFSYSDYLQAEAPEKLVRERVEAQQRRLRVREFVRRLRQELP